MTVLGGGVIEALAPSMMDRIRQVAAKRCLPGCYDEIKIVEAQCKDDAVVLGAARAALDGAEQHRHMRECSPFVRLRPSGGANPVALSRRPTSGRRDEGRTGDDSRRGPHRPFARAPRFPTLVRPPAEA